MGAGLLHPGNFNGGFYFAAEFFWSPASFRFGPPQWRVPGFALLYHAPILATRLVCTGNYPSERLSLIQWLGIAYCIFRDLSYVDCYRLQLHERLQSSAHFG